MSVVVIRTDSSHIIGTGHVMRCLVLADLFRNRGDEVLFICRAYSGNLCDLIIDRGFNVKKLEAFRDDDKKAIFRNHEELCPDWHEDAQLTYEIIAECNCNLLVVDHYGLDERWEKHLSPIVNKIIVIDDLANRKHVCDILIDQNLHYNANKRYLNIVPESAQIFLGPRYALLDKNFNKPSLIRKRNGSLNKILVYIGGADHGNQIFKILNALKSLKSYSLNITIVLGPICLDSSAIIDAVKDDENIRIIVSTDKMAQLMSEADLAVGTCGVAAWERCALGLPSIVVITAENQREDAEILDRIGAVKNLGEANLVSASDYACEIESLISRPNKLKRMAEAALSIMEGRKSFFDHLLNLVVV